VPRPTLWLRGDRYCVFSAQHLHSLTTHVEKDRGAQTTHRKTIAIDQAKNVFQLAISSTPGKVESLKRLNRKDFERFLHCHEPALIIMEACGSSHYWCRELQAMGHALSALIY